MGFYNNNRRFPEEGTTVGHESAYSATPKTSRRNGTQGHDFIQFAPFIREILLAFLCRTQEFETCPRPPCHIQTSIVLFGYSDLPCCKGAHRRQARCSYIRWLAQKQTWKILQVGCVGARNISLAVEISRILAKGEWTNIVVEPIRSV